MSNQIRLAGKHYKDTNQHPKSLAHRQSHQTIPTSRTQQQYITELNQFHQFNRSRSLDQNYSSGGHRAMCPPVQTLRREAGRFNDFRGSDQSRFEHGQMISQTIQRGDNRGYPTMSPARFTYPPVQEMKQPRLYTEFHGSATPRDFICQSVYSDDRDYTQHTAKRTKSEHGYYSTSRDYPPPLPPPRYPNIESLDREVIAAPSGVDDFYSRQRDQGLSAVVSEEKTLQDDSNATQHPIALALPEDHSHLTALHCFIRLHCVYIFCAEANEVDMPRKGRKKPLALGQIGIGCSYCKGSDSKLKGCSYFPSTISGIYNATMIIQQRHFPVCPSVTKTVYGEYNKLKGLTARSASTKQYWISSAKKLGMVDTERGVFFQSMLGESSKTTGHHESSSRRCGNALSTLTPQVATFRSLVEPSDRAFATDYAFFVMAQMTTTTFTEADRLGKRKRHTVGFPGLACKHCFGGNGSGRFFPLTLKTFSDVSKSLHVLRNHLVKCAKAPAGLSAKVSMLYDQHMDDKGTTPFGSQKIFFDHVWRRLHPEMYDESGKVALKHPSQHVRQPRSSSSEDMKLDDPQSQSACQQGQSFELESPDSQAVALTSFGDNSVMPPLPPLPAADFISNQFAIGESKAFNRADETNHRGPAKKRYLSMYYHGNPEPYSDADVSVAMILATGMGRRDQPEQETYL